MIRTVTGELHTQLAPSAIDFPDWVQPLDAGQSLKQPLPAGRVPVFRSAGKLVLHPPAAGAVNPDALGWQRKAVCREVDPELFFTKDTQSEVAQRFCRRCDVRPDCLEFAKTIQPSHGVWGGMRFDPPS